MRTAISTCVVVRYFCVYLFISRNMTIAIVFRFIYKYYLKIESWNTYCILAPFMKKKIERHC